MESQTDDMVTIVLCCVVLVLQSLPPHYQLTHVMGTGDFIKLFNLLYNFNSLDQYLLPLSVTLGDKLRATLYIYESPRLCKNVRIFFILSGV